MPKIIITSPDTNGKTFVGVNGIHRHIPHNKKVEVTDAEMEVLQNADLGLAKIVPQADDEDTDAEVHQVGHTDLKDGTEASAVQAPATPAATSSEPNPHVDGGQDNNDELKGGDVQLQEDTANAEPAPAPAPDAPPADKPKAAPKRRAKKAPAGNA